MSPAQRVTWTGTCKKFHDKLKLRHMVRAYLPSEKDAPAELVK